MIVCLHLYTIQNGINGNYINGNVYNHHSNYKAKLWNMHEKYAYINRAWCRLEMFYNSNLPLGLKHYIMINKRPHIIYGDRESYRKLDPIILAPLHNSNYTSLHPLKGKLLFESDRNIIEKFIYLLQSYMIVSPFGYEGSYRNVINLFNINAHDIKKGHYNQSIPIWNHDRKLNQYAHGKGIFRYKSGSTFTGEFIDGV